jgi:hypothetical protein
MNQNTEKKNKIDGQKIKIGLLSAIGGAIVLAIIGFAWGGWVTGSSATEMAEDLAQKAVLDRIVPICVEQFKQDPERDRKLKELKKLDYYGNPDRSDYVQKQGWATLPGEEEPGDKIAEECAEQIIQMSG